MPARRSRPSAASQRRRACCGHSAKRDDRYLRDAARGQGIALAPTSPRRDASGWVNRRKEHAIRSARCGRCKLRRIMRGGELSPRSEARPAGLRANHRCRPRPSPDLAPFGASEDHAMPVFARRLDQTIEAVLPLSRLEMIMAENEPRAARQCAQARFPARHRCAHPKAAIATEDRRLGRGGGLVLAHAGGYSARAMDKVSIRARTGSQTTSPTLAASRGASRRR